jgi:hypothetical protein
MLLVLLNNLAQSAPPPDVVVSDTHDYVPSFWFEQWDKKKNKKKPEPVAIEHKALEVLLTPQPIAAKQIIQYTPTITEPSLYDDEEDELILIMGL